MPSAGDFEVGLSNAVQGQGPLGNSQLEAVSLAVRVPN